MAARQSPFLRDYQLRVFRGLARRLIAGEPGTYTVLFPRQAGKNELMAALIAWLLSSNAERGGTIIVCAPTRSPQAQLSIDRVRRAFAAIRPALGADIRVSGDTIELGAASTTFLSGLPGAHVAGHTASLALIADEAQELDEEWFDRQFRPMAASTAAPVILFGTPWDGGSLLDRAVAANRAAGDGHHFHATWREVERCNAAYGTYVRAERSRLGAEHPLFRTQYLLETVESAGRLLTAEDIERLAGTHPRLDARRDGERYVAGLDIGGERTGGDRSVLTIARVVERRCEVVAIEVWEAVGLRELQRDVASFMDAWGIAKLVVDATGLGLSTATEMVRLFGDRVEPVVFSAAFKSQLGYALIAAARSGRLAVYAHQGEAATLACLAELADLRAKAPGPDNLRWGAPSGGHDDHAVSLALCVHAASLLGPERVAVGRRRPVP
jgi:hypothetical protein